MKRFWKFIYQWGFPLLIGLVYWLFDATVTFFNPVAVKTTLLAALVPHAVGMDVMIRLVMSVLCVFGARYFEMVMRRVAKLEQQLFLNEFAVENTKAFGMLWTNAEGRIIKVNHFAAERLGYTKQELLSKTLFDITEGHTPEVWQQILTKLKKEGSLKYAARQRHKDGHLVNADFYLQYLLHKTEQYQFAFVCDAFHCPSCSPDSSVETTPDGIRAPCGRVISRSLDQVLKS